MHLILGSLRISDTKHRYWRRLLALSAFVHLRLRDLGLWPKSLGSLDLYLTDGHEKPEWPRENPSRTEPTCVVVTPQLSGRSDEALIASVGAAGDAPFAKFVARASLAVLADEFLNAGRRLSMSHRFARGGTSAALTIVQGMRRVEATLSAGKCEYLVAHGESDEYWPHLLHSMTLSSRRVEMRAWSGTGLRHGRAGNGAEVRRFVVDLNANKVIQRWEFTGPRGVPIKGTALEFK